MPGLAHRVASRDEVKNEDIELAIEINEENLANNERFRKATGTQQELVLLECFHHPVCEVLHNQLFKKYSWVST